MSPGTAPPNGREYEVAGGAGRSGDEAATAWAALAALEVGATAADGAG
jgi:hypothetical protein